MDILQSQKYITLRALERLTQRIGDVKYAKQKWFKWVRNCQDEEETYRDNESKRVKREAALFIRHAKGMESRRRALRAKEEQQRQEEYLEKACNERKLQEEITVEADWDPIEEVVENDCGDFVELLKHFLWQDGLAAENNNAPSDNFSPKVVPDGQKQLASKTQTSDTAGASKASKKTKAKNKKTDEVPTNISETRIQMRQRLREGTEIYFEPRTLRLQGSIVNPGLPKKSPPLPEDEIEKLLEEVSEIRHLLFCRLCSLILPYD